MSNNIIMQIVKRIANVAKTSQFKVYKLTKRQHEELKIIEAMEEPQKSRIKYKYYKTFNNKLTKKY